jgi:hypothetical protein
MSKNVKVNGVDYTGVSQVQLKTTDGGTALFKDVDEITTPSGSVTITENGTHNVSAYAQAVVNVASGGEVESFVGVIDGSLSGDVVLPATVERIKDYAFTGMLGITSITMQGVKRIERHAFFGCENLVLTELPEGLEFIDSSAFYACRKVNITEIPASVQSLDGDYIFYQNAAKTLTFLGTPGKIAGNALAGYTTVNVPWAEGAVDGAPWGAGTINYNYTGA